MSDFCRFLTAKTYETQSLNAPRIRATKMVPKSIMLAHILTVVSLMPKTYRIDNATTAQMAKLIRVMILRLKIVLEICRNFFIVVLLIGELWAVAQP